MTTALIHEVYIRFVNAGDVDWHDRVNVFALSARIMPRILVDAAGRLNTHPPSTWTRFRLAPA